MSKNREALKTRVVHGLESGRSRFGERIVALSPSHLSAHQTIYRHASRFREHSRNGEPYFTIWGAQVHGMGGEHSRFEERKARTKTSLNPAYSITYTNEHFSYTNIILCNRQQQHKTLCCCYVLHLRYEKLVNTQLEPTTDDGELAQLNRIRVETALSRFPIHRLAKKGDIAINLLKRDDKGRTDFKWEVTYNVKHGQPGPLAYKLDTLVINRKIDEAPRPVPKIIKLGTLYEIAQHLDLGVCRTCLGKR